MTLKFILTEEDIVNFNRHYQKRLPLNKINLIILIAASLFVLTFSIIRFINNEELDNIGLGLVIFIPAAVIIVSATVVIFFLLFKLFDRLNEKIIAEIVPKTKECKKNIGEQTLTLHEGHIEDASPDKTTCIPYSKLRKINFGYGCFYIFFGITKAIVIPETAFFAEGHRREFFDLLKQKTNLDIKTNNK